MVAYTYENLGSIISVSDGPRVGYSKRGRDRDRFQTFMFECDPEHPFTGIVHLQGSVESPTVPDNSTLWMDIATIELMNEGGKFFLQTEIELAMTRVVCKENNYWSLVRSGTINTNNVTGGTFTINGTYEIEINEGDSWEDYRTKINEINIVTEEDWDDFVAQDHDIFAIGYGDGIIQIVSKIGDLVLEETQGTPLQNIGIEPGTYTGGRITKIIAMR